MSTTLPCPLLRIDVDRAGSNPACLKEILKPYNIRRIWMFRTSTCLDNWSEPHGLHVDNLLNFSEELNFVEQKLGHVEYWCTHGKGFEWPLQLLKETEKQYSRKCLNELLPVYSVKLKRLRSKDDARFVYPEKLSLESVAQIVFHPCYIYTSQLQTLLTLLEKM